MQMTPTFTLLSPSCSPRYLCTSQLSHFTPPLPFLKEVNKKLSYRWENAPSIIKTHDRNAAKEHIILFLYAMQSRLAGGITFWTCRFVRPSGVRLVTGGCYQLVNDNAWTDFNADWHKSPGARSWTVDDGGQEVTGQGHRRLKLYWEAWRRHHSRSLESGSRGKCYPWKGDGGLHIVGTAPTHLRICRIWVLLTHLFHILFVTVLSVINNNCTLLYCFTVL